MHHLFRIVSHLIHLHPLVVHLCVAVPTHQVARDTSTRLKERVSLSELMFELHRQQLEQKFRRPRNRESCLYQVFAFEK